jgi:hypothetical protein
MCDPLKIGICNATRDGCDQVVSGDDVDGQRLCHFELANNL